ncbi:uncharacterized protein LOC134266453 [Saccostrea cucullata]|uniref:uncharacterized protein LOC134266453 n=1 Tax=Saccostrea cuccullata TaxID=36930 RepID=UPI002ED64994
MIQCRVGAMLQEDVKGCTTKASSFFFAGIKVLTPKVTLSTETVSIIKLQSNVPFADSFVLYGQTPFERSLSIYLSNPSDTDSTCKGRSTNYYKCEQLIPSLSFPRRFENDGKHIDWNKTIEFQVTVKKSIQYGFPPSEVTLRLKTGDVHGHGSKFFENVFLRDVLVQLIDEDPKALPSCHSVTDPHMMSFDKV